MLILHSLAYPTVVVNACLRFQALQLEIEPPVTVKKFDQKNFPQKYFNNFIE